jgi:hypothetical protein
VKPLLLLLFIIAFQISGSGQVVHDSMRGNADSIPKAHARKIQKPSYEAVLKQNRFFNFFATPIVQTTVKREETSKDGLFYLFLSITAYFALVRLLFFRYVNNLFTLFFRASLKQKQIREQLLQTPLPSLLLNILFVICGGVYISFLLRYYHFQPVKSLPFLILYASLGLTVIYLVKFITLKLLGWIFNIEEATDLYIFIVFMVNKVLAMALIPVLVLMAFSEESALTVLVPASYIIVLISFFYRYVIAFAPVRKQINVSQFHFFLYLCGFEIIPLLVIYKVLLSFFERTF